MYPGNLVTWRFLVKGQKQEFCVVSNGKQSNFENLPSAYPGNMACDLITSQVKIGRKWRLKKNNNFTFNALWDKADI